VFPSAVATSADLKIAANLVQSALAVAISATDTIITVRDGSRFTANMLLSIDQEILAATAINGNLITVQRAFDATTAAPHAASALVSVFIDAWHHNRTATEIMAIETFLGPNGQNLSKAIVSTLFDFPAQTPGGTLAPGLNVIMLTPVPPGVNGTDQKHYLYIPNGTGAPEAVLIAGGTAVAGAASGTVIVTCANAHSGAWTIRSASSGIQEAISAVAGVGGAVSVPAGQWDVYALTTIPKRVSVVGNDRHATIIRNQSTTTGAFRLDAPFVSDFNQSMGLFSLTIVSSAVGRTTVDVAAPAVYVYGTGLMTVVADLSIFNHDIGIHLAGPLYAVVERFRIWTFGYAGIYVEYGDGNWIRNGVIGNNDSTSPPIVGNAGIRCKHFSGLYVDAVDITKSHFGVLLAPSGGSYCSFGFFTNVLCDTSISAGWWFDATNGPVNSMHCIDCWASFCGIQFADSGRTDGDGFLINGGASSSGFAFIGCRAKFCGGNGFNIIGGAQIKVVGAEINANSQVGLNTRSGISIDNTAQHVIVASSQIGNYQVAPEDEKQGVGILLVGGAGNYFSIQGNDLTRNNQAALLILTPFAPSASIVIDGNLGVDGVWTTLPSAASIALGPTNYYKITGTVAIGTITGGWSGRRIVLAFTDAVPGGVIATGNVVRTLGAAQNQRMTCEFDGAVWWVQ
jgi:hypothetical protein